MQVIMNRPTRIHTAYPGLLELHHSHFLQDLQELFRLLEKYLIRSPSFNACVQYLMNGTINLHWNNEISIADGLQEETQKHISVSRAAAAVVPRLYSRGHARNTKTFYFPDFQNLSGRR